MTSLVGTMFLVCTFGVSGHSPMGHRKVFALSPTKIIELDQLADDEDSDEFWFQIDDLCRKYTKNTRSFGYLVDDREP